MNSKTKEKDCKNRQKKSKEYKKVAILGKLNTKYKAPFEDKSWEIWGLNKRPFEELPRVDLWFDLHFKPFSQGQDFTRDNFPFEEIDEMLGGHYFNNTVSYLMAYAIYKGYDEIALYGMAFNNAAEIKIGQYGNVRELIFFAKGRGIKVIAPADPVMVKEYPQYTKEYVANKPK